MRSSDQQRHPIDVVSEEFLERYRAGERPSLEHYVDRYPDLADEIRELFPLLVEMEGARPNSGSSEQLRADHSSASITPSQFGDYRIIREIGRGGMGIVYEAEQISLGRRVALKVLPPQMLTKPKHSRRFEREARAAAKLHHTNIVPVFGVGHKADEHYYVMQYIPGLGLDDVIEELRRMKIDGQEPDSAREINSLGNSPGNNVTAENVARSLVAGSLERTSDWGNNSESSTDADDQRSATPSRARSHSPKSESKAPSQSEAISSISSSHSLLYLGNGKAEGRGKRRKQVYWQSVANVGRQVAEALQYAHEQGVLHRDIKPSNLLLDLNGTVWVTDFGLAKVSDQQDLTHSGDILGTLRYMAPEALQGRADARSDLYSLGLTLYELAALRPAFDEKDAHRLVQQVSSGDPPRVDWLNPEIPRDLATIVCKAIDRDATHRYQRAEEMAADLARFLNDEPIHARRLSSMERLSRWSRRNRGLAASLAAICLLLLVINIAGPVVTWRLVRLNNYLKQTHRELLHETARANEQAANAEHLASQAKSSAALATEQAEAAQQANEALSEALYNNRVALAFRELLASQLDNAMQLLRMCPPEQRAWEWHYCNRLCHLDRLTFREHDSELAGLSFSPDGTKIATAGWNGTVKLWHCETGAVVFSRSYPVPAYRLQGNCLAFAPDGRRIALGTAPGEVLLISAETGEVQRSLVCDDGPITSVAYSGSGRFLAATGHDGIVDVWDFSGESENPLLLSTNSRQALHGFNLSVAFCPNEDILAVVCAKSASRNNSIELWNLRTAERVREIGGHKHVVCCAAFSPDGKLLASGSVDKTVRIWAVQTGREVASLRGHTSSVRSIAFSSDGRRLVSGGDDNAIKFWDVAERRELFSIPAHGKSVVSVAYRPGSTEVASASLDGSVKIWSVLKDPLVLTLGMGELISDAMFSPNGTDVITISYQDESTPGAIKRWGEGGRELEILTGRVPEFPELPTTAAIRPDAMQLAWTRRNMHEGEVVLFDMQKRREIHTLRGLGNYVSCVTYSPDGERFAAACQDHTVRIWDSRTFEELYVFREHKRSVESVAYSPDGRWLASASNRTLRLWDPASGHVLWTRPLLASFSLAGSGNHLMTFSPDSRRLVIASSEDAGVHSPGVLDILTGHELFSLVGHAEAVSSLAFSPDGRRIVTGSADKTIDFWDATNGTKVFTLRGHGGTLLSVAFRSDGHRLISVSDEGTAMIWDATPVRAATL